MMTPKEHLESLKPKGWRLETERDKCYLVHHSSQLYVNAPGYYAAISNSVCRMFPDTDWSKWTVTKWDRIWTHCAACDTAEEAMALGLILAGGGE